MFEFAVKRYPDAIAIVQENVRFTYARFDEEINKLAAGLQTLGIEKGDRVLLVTKNRWEMVALYWAIQKIGAVFTPINFRLMSHEIEYCLRDSEAKAIVYEPASKDEVLKATKDVSVKKIGLLNVEGAEVSYKELLRLGEEKNLIRPQIDMDDICLILYTSGTTGKPKGVPRSHKNEYGAAVAHILQNQYVTGESTLGVMPLYHTMGMRSLLSMAFLNGKLVMTPDYSPKKLLEEIEREKITCAYLVPTIYHDLVNHPDFTKHDLSSLTKLGYAGAAMTTSLTKEIFEKLNPKVFVNHYGCTEVYTFTTCNYLDKKPGCAGKPGFHQDIRVVKVDPNKEVGPDDVVAPNVPGEIIANLSSIEAFRGYWKRPDANKKAIRQGWYFTGDLGYFDEDGDLYVVGRVDDMIISGGENIHPLEVEDVLSKHPKVYEVAVAGLPDDHWGQIVTAFIVKADPTLTAQELDQYCRESGKLANFKRPKKYIFVKEIPKSPVGKILRRKLKNGEYDGILDFALEG